MENIENQLIRQVTIQDTSQNANGEFVIYHPNDMVKLEVRIESGTVWLNRNQIALLFGKDVKTIGKHINNAMKEELRGLPTVANFATVQKEGNRLITRHIEYYSIDVILSVGYRVKGQQGILFRAWANIVLNNHLLKQNALELRFERIENDINVLKAKNEKFDILIKNTLPPLEGIFFDGQVFDAYIFVSELIKNAKTEILLIDNYVDETVLNMLSRRNENVKASIYTAKISEQLQLDLDRYNSQYQPITVYVFNKSHDRFLIVDDEIYHIGASLKDLGKKWFAFSKMDFKKEEILARL